MRVAEVAPNKFIIEGDEIMSIMPSNHIGGNWKPIEGFLIYNNRELALQKIKDLKSDGYKLSVSTIEINILI